MAVDDEDLLVPVDGLPPLMLDDIPPDDVDEIHEGIDADCDDDVYAGLRFEDDGSGGDGAVTIVDDAMPESDDDMSVASGGGEGADVMPFNGPVSPFDLVEGPSPLGYIYLKEPRRVICRITGEFNSSVSIKCRCRGHTCSLAIATWKLPSRLELFLWALGGQEVPEGATKAEKAAVSASHLKQLAALRDTAVWPGRSRASLVAEAAAGGMVSDAGSAA